MPPPPEITAAAVPQPLSTLPPAQGRISRQLPSLPANFAVSQPALKPLETLPPEPELMVLEEHVAVAQEEIFEEELVETAPVVLEELAPVQQEIVTE